MPPSWMPIELMFANPQRAKLAITNERASSAFCSLSLPSSSKAISSFSTVRVPEQPAHAAAVFPGHAQQVGDRRQDPAEDRLERRAERIAQAQVDQGDQAEERDQHGGDVQGQVQPVAGPAGRGVEHVGVGPIVGRSRTWPSVSGSRSPAPASSRAGSRRGPS